MINVPFLELITIHSDLRCELDRAYKRVMDSGYFVMGEELAAFEREFAKYSGVNHCVGVGNGLDALKLSLIACDIGEGDEVLIPANTFIATALAVSEVGAKPVLVEPDRDTYNMDINHLEKMISASTRAIIPVHLYGQPADMRPLMQLADENNLVVICDAAQAHGATCYNCKVAEYGHVTAISFYPGKNLGALGDGGAVLTDDIELADKIAMLRNYGSSVKYVHAIKGVNSRLDEMQAAFLRVKLTKLDAWISARRAVADYYLQHISNEHVELPHVPDWAGPVWHLFVIKTPHRIELMAHLERHSVSCAIHYPRAIHDQECYSELKHQQFPVARSLANEILSLPMSPCLSQEQIDHVVTVVNDFNPA